MDARSYLEESGRINLRLWGTACALVCVGHVAAALAALHLSVPRATLGDAAPAVLVELAPLAVAQESTQQNVALGPQMVEAKPEEKPEPKPDDKQDAPEPVQKPDAEVVLPKAEEKPKEENEKQKHQAPLTTAPAKSNQKAADRAVAPAAGATENSIVAQAHWRGAVVARLNQFKRFPPGAAPGIVVVAFTVAPTGAVTSVELVQSSGSSVLDSEAVALVWRANPFLAPPPNMTGGRDIRLTAPIRYVR